MTSKVSEKKEDANENFQNMCIKQRVKGSIFPSMCFLWETHK